MNSDTQKLRADVDNAYGKVRDSLADIHVALESVDRAGAEDDLEGLLEKLEDAVKRARTGGVFGSGAKGHAKALKALREAQGL